ncbi:MAG: DUF1461 domain-containing protein [Clostridia bacterium]|nr:DUF1461 domain-containing protein [Clostridia bacterium]
MTERRRSAVGAAGLVLGLVALMLILILTALHGVGTDGALYYRLQTDAGILPGAGISDGDLQTLDAALAEYLAGRPEALMAPSEAAPGGYAALALNVNGAVQPAFNERETAHLEDCRGLFALLRKVRGRLIPWAVLLIVGGAWLLNDRRRLRRAAWLSPLVLLIPLGTFAIWALADFDAAFTFFHRLLFRNDLWLLNPRTDLLIRICPESMFMAMGGMIALRGLAILAGVPAVATGLSLIWPKQTVKEDHSWNDNRTTRRASAYRQKTFDPGSKR